MGGAPASKLPGRRLPGIISPAVSNCGALTAAAPTVLGSEKRPLASSRPCPERYDGKVGYEGEREGVVVTVLGV